MQMPYGLQYVVVFEFDSENRALNCTVQILERVIRKEILHLCF